MEKEKLAASDKARNLLRQGMLQEAKDVAQSYRQWKAREIETYCASLAEASINPKP